MSPKWKKPSTDAPGNPDRSLKKRLALATVAASLGVSLGVPVGDVLAQDLVSESLPVYTLKEQVKEGMEELDQATEEGKSEAESVQHKSDSFQFKLEKPVSDQLKWDKPTSDQFK